MRTRLGSARVAVSALFVSCLSFGSPVRAAVVNLRLEAIKAPSLEATIASELPILLAAALESAKGFQLFLPGDDVPDPAIAAGIGQLQLEVSGKGPWKISARIVPGGVGAGRTRVAKGRASLAGSGDLVRAVDQLAASIHAGLAQVDATVLVAPGPSSIAEALTDAPEALQAWLGALASLKQGDARGAQSRFEQALAADPGFVIAGVDLHYLLMTAASSRPALWSPGEEAGTRSVSPLAADLRRALGMLARGEAARAAQVGELLFRDFPSLRWGRIIRAISLTTMNKREETVADWELAASVDPSDPRAWNWLGRARLAAGDLSSAGVALRRARQAWPSLLDSFALEAEARARARDLAGARETLEAMRAWMKEQGIPPSSDDTNTGLMLGSLDLLEGRHGDALDRLQKQLAEQVEGSVATPTRTLGQAIVELKREAISSRDPLARERETEDAGKALDAYVASLPPEERDRRPWLEPWLRGLIEVQAGDTIAGWKTITDLKALSDRPGYTEYWEAYLTAMTMLKEGDMSGASEHFARAAAVSGSVFDLILTGQMKSHVKRYEEAREIFKRAEDRLTRYGAGGEPGELILTQPRLAASIPIFHYAWAKVGYFTGEPAESRLHFNRMLKYYTRPDKEFMSMVNEALARGAKPE